MRVRIWFVGAAITAAPLAVGVAVAPAAKPKAKAKPVAITCRAEMTTAIPTDSTTVLPASESGTQYGSVACGKLLGRGVETDAFTSLDSGGLEGTYSEYFGTGTVHGAYHLTPNDTTGPTPGTFASVGYTGTLTVVGGTGRDKLAKGKGTLTCTSVDGLHMTCTARLKLNKI